MARTVQRTMPPHEDSDEEFVRRVCVGDGEAAGVPVERHPPELRARAARPALEEGRG
jgi:hypothetical protein